MTKQLIAAALFAAFGTAFAQAPATPATPATPAAAAATPAKAEAPKADMKSEAKPAMKHGHHHKAGKTEHKAAAGSETPAK